MSFNVQKKENSYTLDGVQVASMIKTYTIFCSKIESIMNILQRHLSLHWVFIRPL